MSVSSSSSSNNNNNNNNNERTFQKVFRSYTHNTSNSQAKNLSHSESRHLAAIYPALCCVEVMKENQGINMFNTEVSSAAETCITLTSTLMRLPKLTVAQQIKQLEGLFLLKIIRLYIDM